jgi:hypothetical protein
VLVEEYSTFSGTIDIQIDKTPMSYERWKFTTTQFWNEKVNGIVG